MTNKPIPRVGTKSKCRHCGEEIIYEPWFRDSRGPNPPIWAHTKGPRTCGTRPKGWRRDSWPFAEPEPEEADSHVCGNCDGVDPDTCLGNPDRPAEPTALREQYAAAIYERNNSGYRWADAHPDDLLAYGFDADAVLAVRDRELERLRAQVARVRKLAERWRYTSDRKEARSPNPAPPSTRRSSSQPITSTCPPAASTTGTTTASP